MTSPTPPATTPPLHIELLYFPGCPSYARAWRELLEVIAEHRLDAAVRPRVVDDPARADALGFAGSPTIRVNGHDLEGYAGPAVLACRRYGENGGRGWPSRELLERALLRAARDA